MPDLFNTSFSFTPSIRNWGSPTNSELFPSKDYSEFFKVDPNKYLKLDIPKIGGDWNKNSYTFGVNTKKKEKQFDFGELSNSQIAGISSALGQGVLSLANSNPSDTNRTLKQVGSGFQQLSFIPGVGQYAALTGTAVNMFGDIGDLAWGHTVSNFNTNKELDALAGSSYLGSQNQFNERSSKNGKKVWSRRTEKNDPWLYAMMGRRDKVITEADDQRKRAQGTINAETERYNTQTSGITPLDISRVLSAKEGIKFEYQEVPDFVYKEAPIQTFQKGRRTLEELIQYAKEQNPRFVQRMSEPIKYVNLENGEKGTHKLSYGEVDGRIIVYPEIFENESGELIFDPKNAIKHALDSKDFLEMSQEEAEMFTNDNYKQGWPQFFNKFQKGGSFNIIPEGALHARKNNMNIEGITKKGIPVISEGDNGKIEQQAEIEHSEIIFRLEVTQKLEDLAKIYKQDDKTEKEKDEAAIEAGKLLVKEILYNTDDRTNLINNEQ